MAKIENFVSFLEKIAKDDSHGYAQDKRYGPDYDCSSFVAAVLIPAGTFPLPGSVEILF